MTDFGDYNGTNIFTVWNLSILVVFVVQENTIPPILGGIVYLCQIVGACLSVETVCFGL
jgi:hypothetical protein